MVTRKEVAERAGVSVMTVTRVINRSGYVSEPARRKVLKAIDELRYIPNKTAVSLVRRENSKMIVIILPDLLNLYYMQLVDCMAEYLSAKGYGVMLRKVTPKNNNEVLKELIAGRVSGVLNMAFYPFDEKLVGMMAQYGVRSIYMSAELFNVEIDYAPAIEEAIKRAAARGVKRVGFLRGKDFLEVIRIKNIKKCCEKYGLEFCNDPMLISDYPEGDSFYCGYEYTYEFLKSGRRCDLLFCLNDTMALGAVKAVSSSGMKVPEDISIIGFDNILTDLYVTPTITSISTDVHEQAEIYASYLCGAKEVMVQNISTRVYYRESFPE